MEWVLSWGQGNYVSIWASMLQAFYLGNDLSFQLFIYYCCKVDRIMFACALCSALIVELHLHACTEWGLSRLGVYEGQSR